MRVLTVDDSASIRHLIRTMLQVVGATVLEAGDGQIALDVLRREGAVDLILLDMEMPNMDGMTFLDHVKKEPDF